MPTKIRLARHGRKKRAYYHIVVADSRAPRDGRFIERLGDYNPCTNPATINLDFEKALDWVQKGAQPTDTVRAILSYQGVMMKKHLLEGVKKGAFDEVEAEKRFNTWLADKESKIQAKKDGLMKNADLSKQKRLEEESKIKEDRAAEIAKRNSALADAERAKEAPEVEAEVEVTEEAAPVVEAEVTEDPTPAVEEEKPAEEGTTEA